LDLPWISENPKECKVGFALAGSASKGAKASLLAGWLAG
jgi:hypothetical protein